MSQQQRAKPPLPKKPPFKYLLHVSSSKFRSQITNRFSCAAQEVSYDLVARSQGLKINDIIYQQKNPLLIEIHIYYPLPLLFYLIFLGRAYPHLQKIMFTRLVCLFLLLSAIGESKPLKQAKIIKALNCGLKEGFSKIDETKYENDQGLVTGASVDVDYHSDASATAADIKFTLEKQLYMYERHTYSSMTYSLPVKTGKHTLILKFAQMYFEKAGQRVFDIKIGDTVAVADMDVIAKSGGKYAAHEQYLEFEIKDASVYLNNVKVKNGLKGGNLQLTFSKGKADNPIIQGLIVYQGPVEETTKQDYATLKKNWGSHQEMLKAKKENEKVKEMIAMTKKREKIVIRNDQLVLEEDQGQDEVVKRQKFGFMRSFLMSPIGILIWAALAAYKLYFVYTKIFLLGKQSISKEQGKEE